MLTETRKQFGLLSADLERLVLENLLEKVDLLIVLIIYITSRKKEDGEMSLTY